MKDGNTALPVFRRKGISNLNEIQGLTLETFKKFDVNLTKIKNEITILKFEMLDYEEKSKLSIFGEKESISYVLEFKTYNIEFQVKFLTFEYKVKSELLKLEVECKTADVENEIKYCCNSLRRRRNLNLMFNTLITFARYLESRRLVCELLLKNTENVSIEDNKDGGKIIAYSDKQRNIKLGVFWSVGYNSDHEVIDKVEVYYKIAELPKRSDIEMKLTQLTEPNMEFSKKFHLWKDILSILSNFKNTRINETEDAQYRSKVLDNNKREQEGREGTTDDALEEIFILKHPHIMTGRSHLIVKKEEPDDDYDTNDITENDKLVIVSSSTENQECSDNGSTEEKHVHSEDILSNTKSDHVISIDSPDVIVSTKVSLESRSKPTIQTKESNQVICIDSAEDVHVSEVSKPTSIFPPETSGSSENQMSNESIEINDTDSESVIMLPSDTEDSQLPIRKKKNSTMDPARFYGHPFVPSTPLDILTRNPFALAVNKHLLVDLASLPVLPPRRPDLVLPTVLSPKRRKNNDEDIEITGITYVVPD